MISKQKAELRLECAKVILARGAAGFEDDMEQLEKMTDRLYAIATKTETVSAPMERPETTKVNNKQKSGQPGKAAKAKSTRSG